MGLNLSKVFITTNTILNKNLGKFDSLNIIGIDQTHNNKLVYLVKDIKKGFYYKKTVGGEGDITELINIVPENSSIEEALKKAVMFELVNLDGTFLRVVPKGKKPPERPSFQWSFTVKPNEQDKRTIT